MEDTEMLKLVAAAAIIGMAGFASAEETKEATEVAKAPTVMTDAQMDEIVAGSAGVKTWGRGCVHARVASQARGNGFRGLNSHSARSPCTSHGDVLTSRRGCV